MADAVIGVLCGYMADLMAEYSCELCFVCHFIHETAGDEYFSSGECECVYLVAVEECEFPGEGGVVCFGVFGEFHADFGNILLEFGIVYFAAVFLGYLGHGLGAECDFLISGHAVELESSCGGVGGAAGEEECGWYYRECEDCFQDIFHFHTFPECDVSRTNLFPINLFIVVFLQVFDNSCGLFRFNSHHAMIVG